MVSNRTVHVVPGEHDSLSPNRRSEMTHSTIVQQDYFECHDAIMHKSTHKCQSEGEPGRRPLWPRSTTSFYDIDPSPVPKSCFPKGGQDAPKPTQSALIQIGGDVHHIMRQRPSIGNCTRMSEGPDKRTNVECSDRISARRMRQVEAEEPISAPIICAVIDSAWNMSPFEFRHGLGNVKPRGLIASRL